MTHRYRIEPAVGLLIDNFEDPMDWRDVWNGMLRSIGDPAFRPGMNVVADLTRAHIDLRIEDARNLAVATSGAPTMKYGRVAVVAPDTLQFGVAQMFGLTAEQYEIFGAFQVFANFSEARKWLGLPEDFELRL